jgi:ATP-dependent DNA helicase DinG
LDVAVTRFCSWRRSELRQRGENEAFALLPEYVLAGRGNDLVAATGDGARALRRLGAELALIAPELERLALGGRARLRRQLERARADIDEAANALAAWLPLEEGEPAFRRETFCDVAEERGAITLVARVLLPAEHLARALYPALAGAVLLSAATRLAGGFDAMERYLGLDLAAEGGAPSTGPETVEERAPRPVRRISAPESFDYARVLVACPDDSPAFRDGREAWRAYTRQFISRLAEHTRGRMLVLLTSQEDLTDLARGLAPELAARGISLLWQGMAGVAKEQLAERFRRAPEAVLLGLDTFWFGADFPGETLEYLVIAKLPYGVPDRYHQAQCAALGAKEQRRGIYMPRALARFRQGFGRLMRRAGDRGCVFVLDRRLVEARHTAFRRELPAGEAGAAQLLVANADTCLQAARHHMERLSRATDAAKQEKRT